MGSLSDLILPFRPVVLILWVMIPLGVKWLFHRGHISDIYIMIDNTRKIMKQQQNNFMVGVTIICGTELKGHSTRKVENHCFRLY
jgi:hypothetical protein